MGGSARRLVDALADAVGRNHVLLDADRREGHERDWTGRHGAPSLAVVRPGSVDDVVAVMAACRGEGASIVTQGGNTGLVGGGVPREDGRRWVVVSTRRLDAIGAVDASAGQVSCGAGVTIAQWRSAARHVGLDAPIDFAARDSATVGGALATNAGGSRVVRFGTMRSQVLGVRAVLADGTIIGSLAGLPKESAGLHWPSLFSGSEGTLGIVTDLRLRTVPWYRHTATALVALESIDAALDLLAVARSAVPSLDAIELVASDAYRLVLDHLDVAAPVGIPTEPGVVVLVELADHTDPTDDLTELLASADGVSDAAVATEPAPRSGLVDVRDRMTEAIAAASNRVGVPTFKLDVAVPLTELDGLLVVAATVAEADGCRLVPFGHLAEGNLHLNFVGATRPERIADRVLTHVADAGGTISAEHGIGVAKASRLGLIRPVGDLDAQRRLRLALDPGDLLNPGVLDAAPPRPDGA